jgi:hypothetical protein
VRTRLGLAVPAALAVGLSALEAHADWPGHDDQAKPCRPTISCTADITAPGTLEVESGALFVKEGGGNRELTFPVLLKLTLARFLQLQVGSNGYTSTAGAMPVRYFDNIYFGPKLHFVDQGNIMPSLALTAQLSLPTFPETGYARYDDAFFIAHASKDIGIIHVDWNVGVNVTRLDGGSIAPPVAQEYTALALSTSLPSVFGVALEAYYFSNADPPSVAPRDGGLRGALSATVRPWMVLDVGGDVGWFPSTRAYSLFFGMTVVPVVFWRSS